MLTGALASAVTGDYHGASTHLAFLFFLKLFLFTPFLLLTRTIPPRLLATREQRSLIVLLTQKRSRRTYMHTRVRATHKHTLALTHKAENRIAILNVAYPGAKAGRES